jgi:hypothetical protein
MLFLFLREEKRRKCSERNWVEASLREHAVGSVLLGLGSAAQSAAVRPWPSARLMTERNFPPKPRTSINGTLHVS